MSSHQHYQRADRTPGLHNATGQADDISGAIIHLPARVAPGDHALDRRQIKRCADFEDDVLSANRFIDVKLIDLTRVDRGSALDRRRVAAKLVAPAGQHLVLVLELLGWAEAVP